MKPGWQSLECRQGMRWAEAASRAGRAATERESAAWFTCDSPHRRAKSSGWAYVSRAARASFQLSSSQLCTMSRQFWVTTEEISCRKTRTKPWAQMKILFSPSTVQTEMQRLWRVLPWRCCSSACWGTSAVFSWGDPPLHWSRGGSLQRNGRRSDTGPQRPQSFQQAAPGWLNRQCLHRKQQQRSIKSARLKIILWSKCFSTNLIFIT